MASKKTTKTEDEPGEPDVDTTETADADAGAAIPNVQAETNHASQAAEDVRDASVLEPGG